MSFLPALLGGAAAVGGALENTKGARTSTGSTTPTYAPEYKTLADLLRQRITDRLSSTMDMSGYTANGITGINDAFKGIDLAAGNNLTARGLGSSPVAGIVGQNVNLARGGEITNLLNTIPQLQRQYENQDLGIASDILNQGRGTTTTGTAPGSALGGAFSSAAEMLAYLRGRGVFGGGSGVNNLPGSIGTGDFGGTLNAR